MRNVMILLIAAACGKVNFDPVSAQPPDAAMPADATVTVLADGARRCLVAEPAQPMWVDQGPFLATQDPGGSTVRAWVSTLCTIQEPSCHAPGASFSLPFIAGDQITDVRFDAFGNSGAVNLTELEVVYQSDPKSPRQVLAKHDDIGRQSEWGFVNFPDLQPIVLGDGGKVWVEFNVTGAQGVGYYLRTVTPVLERTCDL